MDFNTAKAAAIEAIKSEPIECGAHNIFQVAKRSMAAAMTYEAYQGFIAHLAAGPLAHNKMAVSHAAALEIKKFIDGTPEAAAAAAAAVPILPAAAKTCVVCHELFAGHGNNPWPLAIEGSCCDKCNMLVVMERLKRAESDTDDDMPDLVSYGH